MAEASKEPHSDLLTLDPDDVRAAAAFLGNKSMHPGRSSTIFKTITSRRIAKGLRDLYVTPRQTVHTVRQTEQFHIISNTRAKAAISRLMKPFKPRMTP